MDNEPKTTSLWPAKNLVTECMTISAPIVNGFCTRGVAKVLSTPTPIPNFLAAEINAGKSAISKHGFVGDSSQISAAPFMAAITSSVFVISTNRTSRRPVECKRLSNPMTPL